MQMPIPARRPRIARRPPLVWLIASYYLSAGAWSLAIYYQLASGTLTLLPPSRLAYFESYQGGDYALLMAASLLGMAAAVLLLLLRKESVYLFALKFAYSAGLAVWYALSKGALDTSRPEYLLAGLLLWSAAAAVCFYAWSLMQKGVLK